MLIIRPARIAAMALAALTMTACGEPYDDDSTDPPASQGQALACSDSCDHGKLQQRANARSDSFENLFGAGVAVIGGGPSGTPYDVPPPSPNDIGVVKQYQDLLGVWWLCVQLKSTGNWIYAERDAADGLRHWVTIEPR